MRHSWERSWLREWWWSILLCVIIIALVVVAVIRTQQLKDDCEERGGRVVDMNNSRDGSWFCQEN